MKKNLMKGISTVLVALALCVGIPGMANAAPVEDVVSYEKEVTQTGVPQAPQITLKSSVLYNKTTYKWTLSFPEVPKGYYLHFNVYEGNDPKKSESGAWYTSRDKEYFSGWSVGEGSTEYNIYADSFAPGTKTVVAYLYDREGYRASSGVSQADFYSSASNKLTLKVNIESTVSAVVKSNSIVMNFNANTSYVTGYEIYRKEGSKFKKLAKVAKYTYTDKGLTSGTVYTYKVRPYYYNPETKKTFYGEYTQFERTTTGSPMKLKIALSGKKNVKLSWTKVNGAIKYEVYRATGDSAADTISKGSGNMYSSYRLIATLSKNKKSYTDKKTMEGQSYSYMVCAVLNDKQKVAVYDSNSISLRFGAPQQTAAYYNASGARVVEWDKVYGADGYVLEHWDNEKGEYVVDRKLGKNTTKLTIPATVPQKTESGWTTSNSISYYYLYATKGNAKSYNGLYIYAPAYATLGVVSNVSAKRVSNGIQVSWSAVPGAAYYQVYRCNAESRVKDTDMNCYVTDYRFASSSSFSGTSVTEYVGVTTPQVWKDYPYADDNETHYYRNYSYTRYQFTTTSILDYAGEICGYDGDTKEDFHSNYGFESGVTYQYFVVAYAAEQTGTNKTSVYNTTTHTWSTIETPKFGSYYSRSLGCKSLGEATYTNVKAPGKAKIKSVKSTKKKKAVITIKKVKNAASYKIYRSTKKKGTYVYVGETKKTKYTDTGLTSKKTYYYKVVAVATNEAGADVNGASSAVKSVKVK